MLQRERHSSHEKAPNFAQRAARAISRPILFLHPFHTNTGGAGLLLYSATNDGELGGSSHRSRLAVEPSLKRCWDTGDVTTYAR